MLVDWAGLILSMLKALKKEDTKVDPKYIVIKPRILSDHNILRGVSALRAVLAFIPATSLAGPVLSLGEVGFQIWKKIALSQEYDGLIFTPIDPNVMRILFQGDTELRKYYGQLCTNANWGESSVQKLEGVYNDFSFITSEDMLRSKYPHVSYDYIYKACLRNRDLLNESIFSIEQELTKISQQPEVDANIREAIEALKELFPAMRDWALFDSDGFDGIVDIIDVVL